MKKIVGFVTLAALVAGQMASIKCANAADAATCCKEKVCCKEVVCTKDPCAKKATGDEQQAASCSSELAAEPERCGLDPCRVRPTDVLKDDATTCRTGPKVNGNRAVRIAEWMAEQVNVEAQIEFTACNSKAVFLVTQNTPSGDYVMRVNCTPETTVGSVFKGAVWPQPIDFSAAEISLHRTPCNINSQCGDQVICDELVQQVVWDARSGQPTAATDFPLLPSDRLFVKLPASPVAPTLSEPLAAAAPYCSPVVPPPAPPAPVAVAKAGSHATIAAKSVKVSIADGSVNAAGLEYFSSQPSARDEKLSQVVFRIDLVKDPKDSLTEFKGLRKEMAFITVDSETILPALRILEKHGVIKKLSSPTIAAASNCLVHFESGGKTGNGDDTWEGVKVELRALERGEKLTVAVTVELTQQRNKHGVSTSVLVGDGETLIMKTRASRDGAAADDEDPPVYVVITPTLVK